MEGKTQPFVWRLPPGIRKNQFVTWSRVDRPSYRALRSVGRFFHVWCTRLMRFYPELEKIMRNQNPRRRPIRAQWL
jgi:hypothetical protein